MDSNHLSCDESDLANDGLFAPGIPGEHEQLSPEQQLFAAMLRQALLDAGGHVGSTVSAVDRRRVIAEAQAWIRSRSDRPLGFVWVCQMLRLDPEFIREHRRRVVRDQHVHVKSKTPTELRRVQRARAA